jgi:rare lipoprotein A
MRRRLLVTLVVFAMYGCATTAPPPTPAPETLRGVASWYGEEFAGRTTANGEIFDPTQLTAAHRTLPFGTVVDVTNKKTSETVRVRINDRGPYVGQRVIDLSYAAARKIGLIQPGSGEVDIAIVKLGRGEREPPVPFEVTVAQKPATVAEAPKVDFPLPTVTPRTATPEPVPAAPPVVVDAPDIAVIEETPHGSTYTRRQVSSDGKTIETVEVNEETGAQKPVAPLPATPAARTPSEQLDRQRVAPAPAPARRTRGFFVQVGAFSVEANALALQERLTRIGQTAHVDREELYRVRLGPFTTREQAAAARATLEANGMSAIIVAE